MDFLPREKISKWGIHCLSDTELIAVILGTGYKEEGVKKVSSRVASRIRQEYQDAEPAIFDWRLFQDIKGVGIAKAMKVVSCLELGSRLFGKRENAIVINDRQDVRREMAYLRNRNQEYVVALFLNARHELLGKATVAVGSQNMAIIEPREVFFSALKFRSSFVILVHNHPSGNSEPSQADVEFTSKIKRAGSLLGIELIDHVII